MRWIHIPPEKKLLGILSCLSEIKEIDRVCGLKTWIEYICLPNANNIRDGSKRRSEGFTITIKLDDRLRLICHLMLYMYCVFTLLTYLDT